MTSDSDNVIPFPLIVMSVFTAALRILEMLLFVLTPHSDDNVEQNAQVMTYAIAATHVLNDTESNDNEEDMEGPTKHRRYNYDYSPAKVAVQKDYLGPVPIFDDKQFKRIFCVSKAVYETIRAAVRTYPFFSTNETDCCGQPTIGLDVKILMALEVNAYGVAANAFRDYYQMGESTAHKCCDSFNEAITQCTELTSIFLRKMTKADARRVAQLHFSKHGIHGMLGCLDCMHIIWKNCPVALQGAFCGKEGMPTLVLEAMADFHLWIWHASFGFAGALND